MKRFLLFALLVFLISLSSFSQGARVKWHSGYDERLLHFGFSVGVNTMDFGFNRPAPSEDGLYAEINTLSSGFNVNVVTDLRLGSYWSLRFLPGINLGQRNLTFYDSQDSEVSTMFIESNFLDIPFLLKYKAMRINNFRPYVIGGVSFKYDWAARKDYDYDSNVFVRLKPFDVYYDVGAGIDKYMKYFKLSVELRLSVGVNNVKVDQPAEGQEIYANSIDALRSKMVMLSFYFE